VSAIELDRVSVSLGGHRVVRDVDAVVEAGEWVALIGPNGAGKTSLLRAVAGLLPCEGTVRLDGVPLAELGRPERAQRLALVPQEPRTPPWLSGACFAMHRDLWTTVAGFDDDYFLYWEDVDLSYRVVKAGGRLAVRQDLVAVHDVGGTQHDVTQRAKSSTYYYYSCRNRLVFAAKGDTIHGDLGPFGGVAVQFV